MEIHNLTSSLKRAQRDQNDKEAPATKVSLMMRERPSLHTLPHHIISTVLNQLHPNHKLSIIPFVSRSFKSKVFQKACWRSVDKVHFSRLGGTTPYTDERTLQLKVLGHPYEGDNLDKHKQLIGLLSNLKCIGFMKSVTTSPARQELILNLLRDNLDTVRFLDTSLRLMAGGLDGDSFNRFLLPLVELIIDRPISVRAQSIEYSRTTSKHRKWNQSLLQIDAKQVRLLCRDLNEIVEDVKLINQRSAPSLKATLFVTDPPENALKLINRFNNRSLVDLHLVCLVPATFDYQDFLDRLLPNQLIYLKLMRLFNNNDVHMTSSILTKILQMSPKLSQFDCRSQLGRMPANGLVDCLMLIWLHTKTLCPTKFHAYFPSFPKEELEIVKTQLTDRLTAEKSRLPFTIDISFTGNEGNAELKIRQASTNVHCVLKN